MPHCTQPNLPQAAFAIYLYGDVGTALLGASSSTHSRREACCVGLRRLDSENVQSSRTLILIHGTRLARLTCVHFLDRRTQLTYSGTSATIRPAEESSTVSAGSVAAAAAEAAAAAAAAAAARNYRCPAWVASSGEPRAKSLAADAPAPTGALAAVSAEEVPSACAYQPEQPRRRRR
jgi:hypothetical protein